VDYFSVDFGSARGSDVDFRFFVDIIDPFGPTMRMAEKPVD